MDPNDLDMSASGSELFPEQTPQQYNSYQDVQQDPLVQDHTGVQQAEAAAPQMSDKEYNFRALRDEIAKVKEERDYYRGQADAYNRQPVRSEPAQEPYNPFKDLSGDDWVKASNVQEAFNHLRSEFQDKLAAVETKTQHSDWNTMVTQHVPQLTSKNPIFAEMIQKASNPYEAAYLLAELNARAGATQPPQQQYGQRAVNNAQKPQTLSGMGGHAHLNQADYYASMSDEDFMKMAARNLASI